MFIFRRKRSNKLLWHKLHSFVQENSAQSANNWALFALMFVSLLSPLRASLSCADLVQRKMIGFTL
jgi:hypothetical protein